jgi:hypothetical protein
MSLKRFKISLKIGVIKNKESIMPPIKYFLPTPQQTAKNKPYSGCIILVNQ